MNLQLQTIPNSTMVTEFLLEFFAETWELRLLISMLLLVMYLGSLLGNLTIIMVSTIDQNLQTPMYFFLRNLSIIDMCYISVTIPKACINSLTDNRGISVTGCAAQLFSVTFCGCLEFLLLTVMAQDRYVAICQPLLYPVIMNHQFCIKMTLASLLLGLVIAGSHTVKTFQLSFCSSNLVSQFFCDIPPLLKLSCSDTFNNKLFIFLSAIIIDGGCCFIISVSYVHIFSTVLKFPLKEERRKAFSTCVPHIIVVSLFLISGTYVYIRPPVTSEVVQDMVMSIFYTIIPPFLNPVIYSLRNKQIKEAVKKIMLRIIWLQKL
ncbi:olfactory receptor 14C36-like [Nannospalax galili]|uniref:olfactory receptor 14C36-like n=1 Tax=Nannospalax galili TaxID=1026970 RepID=UPI000819F7E1|nr:olfactory receptor 14C36-like [Nannospalax galili]